MEQQTQFKWKRKFLCNLLTSFQLRDDLTEASDKLATVEHDKSEAMLKISEVCINIIW